MHKIKKFAAEHKREIIFAAIYLLIVAFRFSWFYTHETAIVYRDSQDYLAYDPIRALQGSAVNGRAPVYGTILYLIRIIVGEWHQLHAATFAGTGWHRRSAAVFGHAAPRGGGYPRAGSGASFCTDSARRCMAGTMLF